MGKILLIASVAVSVLTAGLGIYNGTRLSGAKAALDSEKQSAASSKQQLEEVTKQLDTTKTELAAATNAKESSASELSSLQASLKKAQDDLTQINSQIASKESELTQLRSDNEAKTTRIAQLESATTTTADTSELEGMKAQLEEKNTLLAKYETDNASLKGQLDEFRKREENRQNEKMRAGLEGKILAVNPAWNFVVLNLGDRNGVVSNAEMLVKRGTNLLGKIRITSVEPSTSIADIVSNSVAKGISIQPGDTVIYQEIEE